MRRRKLLSAGLRNVIHAIVDCAREVRADIVHIRNKQITPRELLELTRWFVERRFRVVVNTRCDVALAARAAGVHLPSDSVSVRRFRTIVPADFLIGVSCHSREELEKAQEEGADYAYLSPVFRPLSKTDDRRPMGLDGFARSIAGLTIPILALGGMSLQHYEKCRAAGAAGIAGISLAMARDQAGS